MAITWGAAQADSTNAFRIGYELTMSPSTVSSSTSSVTLTVKLYLGTKYYANDSGVDWSIGAGFSPGSGSKSFDHNSSTAWSSSNVTLLSTVSRSVSTSYSANVTGTVNAYVTGLVAIAGTASVPVSWNIPKRPVSAPAAPTGCSHTRASDTQHTVTWSNTSPTNSAAPYQNVEVERQTNEGSWARIATVGVVTSYTDKSTVANRKYKYRVRAKNSGGVSGYSTDSSFMTTPDAPSSVVAKKTGASIALTWVDNSPWNTGIQVWHAADGVWDASPLATLGAVTSWTDTAPSPSVTHTYRLKATTTTPSLASAYSSPSDVVQLLGAPLAPTQLSPSTNAVDALAPITFSWRHNPIDTTDQTQFELQYRLVGAGTWDTSGVVTSSTQAWTTTLADPPYSNGNTIEWQVRTWGDYTSPSPWSATVVVPLSSPPTVLINSPDGVTPWPLSKLTVTWGYNDAESNPQAAYRATLYGSTGGVLEVRAASGDAGSVAFTTALSDGGSYSVGVLAQDSTGIWSDEDVMPFAVSFAPPPTPVVTVEWRPDDAAAIVSVENPPTIVGEVDATSVQVWRAIDDGEWVLLADGLPLNATITDFIPALNLSNWYRAIAISDTPSSAESVSVEVLTEGTRAIVVNAGAQFSQSVQLASDPKVDISTTRARTMQRFAGRTLPVEYAGEQRSRSLSLSASLYDESPGSTWEEVSALADLPAPACYRDPDGRRVFVSMGDPSASGFGGPKRALSWSLTEIDWIEPTEAT